MRTVPSKQPQPTPHQISLVPNLIARKVCCGEIEADGTPVDSAFTTFTSTHTGDALIEVTRLSSGTGERLGGTWYLSLDGEASERIAADARAEEVMVAVSNLPSAGNVTVADGADGEGPNGERSWVILFHDWNDPNRTATNQILTVGDEGLTGTAATATIGGGGVSQVSEFCDKAAVKVTSALSAGEIDDCAFIAHWQGGTSYVVPAFAFDANSSIVKEALASVDKGILGEVWVSRDDATGGARGIWNITFVENAEGRTPELDCGSDAAVLQLMNATCEPIGGAFTVGLNGNATRDISYNATDAEVSEKYDSPRGTH